MIDANGKRAGYARNGSSYQGVPGIVMEDFSTYDVTVNGGDPNAEAPQILLDTLKLVDNKKEYRLGEEIKWSVKVTSKVPIAYVEMSLGSKIYDKSISENLIGQNIYGDYDNKTDSYILSYISKYC